ncbi:response regulator transcription factor [Sphingobacterium sp. DN00404]|uniref:Response regulator transcription factor n=1 Tax=Sphingobacterium micropteri TaxID=2763501 RepID=A0ABR7YPE6_9SPHI|nr:LytTR family DNA-binding domain-containing protein [Sphingobacterium micropteri]MBD1433214.1 response regulator transcription factor [Sphingobacterium micropteri]
MRKQTLLIVDRDCLFRRQLIDEVKQNRYPATFWEACNGLEALRHIDALQPDVVFISVRLPGINGFEVLDRTEHSPAVILTSETPADAAKAFEYDAVDYLLKPLTTKRLQASLHKLECKNNEVGNPFDKKSTLYPRRILVEKGNRLTCIPVSEITHLKADKDYTWIYTLHNESFLSTQGIGQFMQRLDPHQFLRVHRSYVVNLDHLKELYKDIHKTFITLPNNVELNVSRNYLPAIKELMY